MTFSSKTVSGISYLTSLGSLALLALLLISLSDFLADLTDDTGLVPSFLFLYAVVTLSLLFLVSTSIPISLCQLNPTAFVVFLIAYSLIYLAAVFIIVYLFFDQDFFGFSLTDIQNDCANSTLAEVNLTLFVCSDTFEDVFGDDYDNEVYMYVIITALVLLWLTLAVSSITLLNDEFFWLGLSSDYEEDEHTQGPKPTTLTPVIKSIKPGNRLSANLGHFFRKVSKKPPPGLGFNNSEINESMGYDTMKRIRESGNRGALDQNRSMNRAPEIDLNPGFTQRNFGARGGTDIQFTDIDNRV